MVGETLGCVASICHPWGTCSMQLPWLVLAEVGLSSDIPINWLGDFKLGELDSHTSFFCKYSFFPKLARDRNPVFGLPGSYLSDINRNRWK